MDQWIKMSAAKSGDLGLISRTQRLEGKLSSDLHMCSMTCAGPLAQLNKKNVVNIFLKVNAHSCSLVPVLEKCREENCELETSLGKTLLDTNK